jgi:hypothetical protein
LHLRGLVRRNEAWFIALAAGVGAVWGLSVTVVLGSANLLHRLFFGRSEMSSLTSLASPYLVLGPLAGGLIIGISAQSSNQWVALTDRMERYVGIVFVPDVHLAGLEAGAGESALAELAKMPNQFLLPGTDIKSAEQAFEQTESEALAVLDNEKDRRIIGLLTEAHVLRRYTDELAKAHRDLMGENWFSGRL